MRYLFVFIPLVLIIFSVSCRKDTPLNDSSVKLQFSTDTVMFDTVFTSVGSTTKSFKVYNRYKQPIVISSLYLAGGNSSNFRINVDGTITNSLKNLEIPAQDSIFIFVEVTVNPTGQLNPMLITDSIVFITNGNIQDINLVAIGQDVHLINKQVFSGNVTLVSDKPYLIYYYMYIDSTCILTINEGAKLYFMHNAGMHVKGTVLANGSKEKPILFLGSRLEPYYNEIPGQWGGIIIYSGSKNNLFNYVTIKNGIVGLQIGTLENIQDETSISIINSKIMNMNFAGIYSFNATIFSANSVIANCGFYTVALLLGGQYEFYHCTLTNYWGYSNRTDPLLVVSNNIIYNNTLYLSNLNKATFGNCIIYGNKENEIGLSNQAGANFNYLFDHSLMKIKPDLNTNTANYNAIYKNTDPKFISVSNNNYKLDTLSFAKDKGSLSIVNLYPIYLTNDIEGNSRIIDAAPDLGAYERKQ